MDTSSAGGRLVLNVMTAVSQWEREAIGERTRDAMNHKRNNGERVGNIRFGYRLSVDGKHVKPTLQSRMFGRSTGSVRVAIACYASRLR